MTSKRWVLFSSLALVALAGSVVSFAQKSTNDGGWRDPVWKQDTKVATGPAPKHNISGLWGTEAPNSAVQAGGVQAMPNDGKPEHQLPFTPYGLKLYKTHKAVEGFDAVAPGDYNDPRELCEPLGFPRANHYQLRLVQIFQDDAKVAILYQYDNRWRFIWTDGRALPTLVEGGVKTGDIFREPRFYGFSVGKWIDDTTLVAQTVGTMPEDRVWLDATGRAISDQLKVTETYHRVNGDTLEMSEVIDDPKIYTKPWTTIDKLPLKLKNPSTDILEFDCSPVEQRRYDQLTGAGVEFETPKNKKK
jgi:hypothetical protein